MLCLLALLTIMGCGEGKKTSRSTKSESPLKVKSTDEIGEFHEEEGKEVVDSKVKYSNPVTGPLEAYDPLKQKISELAITQSVQHFYATEGRYPKDYNEFMTKVIRENGVRLPTPGLGKHYEYDVANHKLVVVADPAK